MFGRLGSKKFFILRLKNKFLVPHHPLKLPEVLGLQQALWHDHLGAIEIGEGLRNLSGAPLGDLDGVFVPGQLYAFASLAREQLLEKRLR